MSLKTFEASCVMAEDRGSCITLGGGEPTLHPQFTEFLAIALGHQTEQASMFVATNGTNTKISKRLANMAEAGILSVDLSLDDYHPIDQVDPEVIALFQQGRNHHLLGWRQHGHDLRGIRTITEDRVLAAGRAKNWGQQRCACEDLFVAPTGELYQCGCKLVQVGTIRDPDMPDYYEGCSCDSGEPL